MTLRTAHYRHGRQFKTRGHTAGLPRDQERGMIHDMGEEMRLKRIAEVTAGIKERDGEPEAAKRYREEAQRHADKAQCYVDALRKFNAGDR